MPSRVLATNVTNFSSGALGLVEYTASLLNDRQLRFWSKSELMVYLNEAQHELAEEINRIYREFFLSSSTTPTVSGQDLYSLPTDMVELVSMEVVDSVTADNEPQDLTEILLTSKKFYEVLADANQKKQYQYFFIQGANFKLTPGAASSSEFIRIFYVKRLAALVNDGDISEIPAEHHEMLSIDAARRALVKTRNPNPVLEQLRVQRMQTMRDGIQRFSRHREERRSPWRGSYGPDRDIRGGQSVI
jgi:hypothetical protein